MMERFEKRLIIVLAAAVSLVAHLWALHAFSLSEPVNNQYEPKIIELVNLPAPKPVEIKKPEPEKKLTGQVVDLGPEDPEDTTPPPENARYLSERNMRTDRETVKISRARTGSPGRRSSAGRDKQQSAGKPGKAGGEEAGTGGRERAERGLVGGDAGEPVRIASNFPPGISREDLKISISDLEYVLGADDGSIDYVPTAARGEVTSLNAQRFTYASYFNRMKKVIVFYWHPAPVARALHLEIGVYRSELELIINSDGTLESVEVIRSSGYPGLDAAAIKGIRKAAPFFKVPPGLLDSDGKFFSRWGFHFHVAPQ